MIKKLKFLLAAFCLLGVGLHAQTYPQNLKLITAIQVHATATDQPIIRAYDYDSSTTNVPLVNWANKSQVGAVYGLGYSHKYDKVYTSSYVRRHTKLGTGNGGNPAGDGSAGAIYAITRPTTLTGPGTVSVLLDIGAAAGTTTRTPGVDYNCDPAYYEVGRTGWGDIDVSVDGDTLWAMNLYNKSLYKISLADGVIRGIYPIPGVTGGPVFNSPYTSNENLDFRPFGIGIKNGKVYVGVINSGESLHTGNSSPCTQTSGLPATDDADSLAGYVFTFDMASTTYNTTPVLEFKFTDYRWQWLLENSCNQRYTYWIPQNATNAYKYSTLRRLELRPLITDIDFEEDDLLIGIRNIHKDLYGAVSGNFLPDCSSTSELNQNGFGGKLLKANYDTLSGHWIMENNGISGGEIGYDTITYYQNNFAHGSVDFAGSMANAPQSHIVGTWSTGASAGSVVYINKVTKSNAGGAYNTLYTGTNGSFGKANSLGDIDFFTECTPPVITSVVETRPACNLFTKPVSTITINATTQGGVMQYSIDNGITWQMDPVFPNLQMGEYNIVVRNDIGAKCHSYYAQNPYLLDWDSDCDGVDNKVDIDDDNDGILDHIESPTCFYTSTEANTISSITSEYTSPDAFTNLYDGSTALIFNFDAAPISLSKSLFTITYPFPIPLSSVISSHRISGTSTARAKLFGSVYGTDWVQLSIADVNINTATNVVFPVEQNFGNYKYYRIQPTVGGNLSPTYTIGEISTNIDNNYLQSKFPKLVCALDTDTDNMYNHQDIDADGDLCIDAIEGNASFTNANVSGNGMLIGAVNADGLPLLAAPSGQGVGTSNNSTLTDVNCVFCTPPIADAGATQNLNCTTPSATIGSAAISGVTYSWSPSTGLNDATIAQPTANPTTTTTYTVTVADAVTPTCSSTSTVTVNVDNTLPTAGITGTTTVCNGSTTTLTATGGSSYVWSNTDATANTTVGVGTYTVTVTGSNGCTATSSVTVNNAQGSVGNYVWLDANKNGINDEPTTDGINGVTVELWNATTNTMVATTTTANDGSSNPGFYNFVVCASGDYKVKFPTTNSGNNITTQTTTTATDNNSDADVATGFSPVFTIDVNGTGVAKDNNTIDAGYQEPLKACLGNYVFNDADHDGTQNNGEVGVSGVTVSLLNGTTNAILATITSDAYGFYQFCGLTAGDYKVKFSLPSNYIFTGQNAPNDATDSDPNVFTGITDAVTLVAGDSNMTVDAGIFQPLPVTATVGDRVWFDADGNGTQDVNEYGVSGITVSLFDCSNLTTPIATTVTDAGGNYLFENVVPGSFSVGFSLPGGMVFTTQSGAVSSTSNSDADAATGKTSCFTVASGSHITYVDAGIKPKPNTTVSIGDKVWNDANQDGIQDPSEGGVQGVTVTLYDATGTNVIYTTTTDGLGNYSFNGFPAGCYVVGFSLPSGYTRTLQNVGTDTAKNSDANAATGMTNQICISAGQNNPTIDAGIYNSSNTNSIGDKVWYDEDKDGLQDPTEYGYPGVVVTLYDCSTNTIIATTTTNANGSYLFDGVANGDYYVGFGFVPGYSFTGANSDVAGVLGGSNSDANPSNGMTDCISLAGNTNITTVDAGIYPGSNRNATSSLGDIVWTDANNNGLQDNDETGVSGVTVNLYNCSDLVTPVATTITDGLGNYIFTNLLGGNYAVGFSNLPAGYTFTTKGSNIEDEDNSDVNIATGQTDCIALGLGEDKMNVDAGIIAPAGTVCLGNYVWIDLDNDGTQEPNEPAVPGVTVKLYDNNTNTVLQVATTNSEGNYLFCGLTNGSTYSVGFENLPAGFSFTAQTGILSTPTNSDANPTTGRTTTVTMSSTNDLTLDAGIYSSSTAVVGNYVWYDEDADGIQDPTEAPIPGVLVTMYDNTNTSVASAVTDANGGYLFTNVIPGTYTIGFEGYPSSLVPTTKGTTNPETADDDSNIDPITGRTDAFTVTAGSSNLTLDAGYKANPIAGLGNYVWYDVNEDGLQGANEPSLSGVVVTLYAADGTTPLGTAITDGNGAYSFPNLTAGNYVVGFSNVPSGFTRTQSVGALNDALNSDIGISNKTATVTLLAGTYNPNIDAGFYFGVPLPVSLTQFNVYVNDCNVDLKWQTEKEQNTAYFNVFRKSEQDVNFVSIGEVKAAGNSQVMKNYTFRDLDVNAGSNQYKLQMVDLDGRIEESPIQVAVVNCSRQDAVSIYPNPAGSQLFVQFDNENSVSYTLNLRDIAGKLLKQTQLTTQGKRQIELDVNDLSNGLYSLEVVSNTERKIFKLQLSK